jgi:ABC-type cobalamin/Fe3+-siderophores transport system ATPase subunit
MAPLLSLMEVSRRRVDGWRESVVLDRASLEIEAGDFVGLFGAKRSGKSTLLRIMAGMEQPDSGTVRFDGQLVTAMSARRRARLLRRGGIALVSSEWRAPLVRPVVELVAAACGSDGTPMPEARARARHALSRVGVVDCADMPIDRLATGQRLRACLATALVREPRLLLVDEPAVLPSPMESEELYALLRSLGEERDVAVVIASEDLTPLTGTPRRMIVSSGTVRSMDSEGVVVQFPQTPPARVWQAGDTSR